MADSIRDSIRYSIRTQTADSQVPIVCVRSTRGVIVIYNSMVRLNLAAVDSRLRSTERTQT